jgi:mono/diheme cytochrome c family protein
MKTLLKIVGALVAVVVLVAICGLGYLFLVLPSVPPAANIKIEATPERIARGKYLNDHVVGCTTCHTQRDFTKFSGPVKEELLGSGAAPFDLGPAGIVYSKNITPAGIGDWTDGEVIRAVTQGVSKDGSPLFPVMPYPHFGAMSEDDVHAVVAYIRTLKAIPSTVPPRKLSFPLNLIVRTIPKANTYGVRPSPENKVAYGKYMVDAGLCSECHTPIDDQGTPLPGMDFAGGTEILETGYRVHSANLTPDANTGLGSWTEQQFIDKFKAFETPTNAVLVGNERAQNTPMPITVYAGMTREDLSAMFAYLRTLKPVTNRVEKFPDAK